DNGKVTHAGERELQGSRDRCGGEREHMDLGSECLELLLVRDAKMLLFVDYQQRQILELDRLAKHGMGADDDIDATVGETSLDFAQLRGRHEPRGLCHVHGEAPEAL